MSKPTLITATVLLLASVALAGCSAVSQSSTTTSSRDGIHTIHQTLRKASISDLAAIQAMANESADAADGMDTRRATQGEVGH
jgi:hypothetical protein